MSAIAADFSPRYERHRDDLVSIDISGLGRLLGSPREIGEELRRDADRRGLRVNVAVAATRTAALVLAIARPGLTVVDPGNDAAALAPINIRILEHVEKIFSAPSASSSASSASSARSAFHRWGIKTLGELAALPSGDLAARLGSQGLVWQTVARGDDARPLVPTVPDERFEASVDLEWPIEGLEPLSFVLTRLLEPLSIRLERRDRGAAVLHVELRLVGTGLGSCSSRHLPATIHARSLQLPSPMRDVRALRTLALLDLESHPPAAAADRVTVVIEPTPGRILQHQLFTRAQPTPEQLSTLIARLAALMGPDRIGAPATVDSYRPGAFEMRPFATEHGTAGEAGRAGEPTIVSALRRCREPVPARVAVTDGRPVRVTTDRRGFAGGTVVQAAGPWRTSGNWWAREPGRAGEAGTAGEDVPGPACQAHQPYLPSWSRDEWDVALSDSAVYRIFQDRETDGWFIDGIVD